MVSNVLSMQMAIMQVLVLHSEEVLRIAKQYETMTKPWEAWMGFMEIRYV